MTRRYQPNAGGLKRRYQTTETCYVCGFTVERNRAIEIDTGDGMRWRHRELHVCLANAERLALADLLLGGRKQP